MQLTFLGGADEVGASCTLIEIAGKKILVDAGIRISPKTSRGLQNDQLPHLAHLSDIGGPDVILVTHAHTDHTGALPQVVRSYPRVPIYGTQATIDLSRVLLSDSSRLMETRLEAEGELPLYDKADVDRLLENWQPIDFGRALTLGSDLQVTPYVSGHIAGAAMLVFESSEGVLVMSGDVSVSTQRTVESAKPPRIKADALVLESTYGGRQHANRRFEEQRLIDTLKQVAEGGGKALIPAFALGRAQEVIQILLAYRDQLDVPVYVDGMVRLVCDAYSGFQDILPKPTVKMANNKALFFRQNVKPVRTRNHREEIMRSSEPCVIVSSSGMLTGGASVAYAAALAPDPRNGIFLTGYQDEESPGRFIQNVIRSKERGDTPMLKLGEKRVPLNCHVGTYSLSAHADEAELVSMAEAMDAQRVFLVHGDATARQSLWQTLLNKGRKVARPKAGQDVHVQKRRMLALKRDGEIGEIKPDEKPLVAADLWKLIVSHQGEIFTARELAQIWYSDVERAADVVDVLEDDTVYFLQNWRDKQKFTVKRQFEVEQALLGQQLLRTYGDLSGQLVVLRTLNGDPRLAVVQEMTDDGFIAVTQGTKGKTYFGHALLWPMGEWTGTALGDAPDNAIKLELNTLLSDAEGMIEQLLPYEKREQLANDNDPIAPDVLLAEIWDGTVPPANHDERKRYQLHLAAIVLGLARDGAVWQDKGLWIEIALKSGPVNQQVAREIAMSAFPAAARLRKVGMLPHKNTLIMNFDFPHVAQEKFAEELHEVRRSTGWTVNLRMTTNQNALLEIVEDMIPAGCEVVSGPSLYLDQRLVSVEVVGMNEETCRKLETTYQEETGWQLQVIMRSQAAMGGAQPTVQAPIVADHMQVTTDTPREPIEINAAYAMIRGRLDDSGLQKTGLKNGEIVLTFISPQVGQRHLETIAELSEATGYTMRIHPHPMQNLILDEVRILARQAGWIIRKGPGIHMESCEVSMKLETLPDAESVQRVNDALMEKTAYSIVVR